MHYRKQCSYLIKWLYCDTGIHSTRNTNGEEQHIVVALVFCIHRIENENPFHLQILFVITIELQHSEIQKLKLKVFNIHLCSLRMSNYIRLLLLQFYKLSGFTFIYRYELVPDIYKWERTAWRSRWREDSKNQIKESLDYPLPFVDFWLSILHSPFHGMHFIHNNHSEINNFNKAFPVEE